MEHAHLHGFSEATPDLAFWQRREQFRVNQDGSGMIKRPQQVL